MPPGEDGKSNGTGHYSDSGVLNQTAIKSAIRAFLIAGGGVVGEEAGASFSALNNGTLSIYSGNYTTVTNQVGKRVTGGMALVGWGLFRFATRHCNRCGKKQFKPGCNRGAALRNGKIDSDLLYPGTTRGFRGRLDYMGQLDDGGSSQQFSRDMDHAGTDD